MRKLILFLVLACAIAPAQFSTIPTGGGGGGVATTDFDTFAELDAIVADRDLGKRLFHATDCTALTIGLEGDICTQQSDNKLFACVPTAGGCDTAGEWIQAAITSEIFTIVEDPTSSCGAGEVAIYNKNGKLIKCEAGTEETVAGLLTNQFQPITRWAGTDMIGYVFPDIALNIFEAEQTQVTHDALFRFSPETTANAPITAAGSRRMYIDSRTHVRSDFASNITLKAWYSSETASGNYRFNVYFKSVADGESIVLPEVLSDLSFASCANWSVTGDFACGGGDLTYTHSSGVGTATMASASFATAAKANMYYNFGYTTSEVAGGGPACTITTAFGAEAVTLTVNANVTNYDQFVSAAAPGNFVISCTSGASDVITIDNVTLRPVFDQVVQLTSAVPGTTHLIDVIEFTPGTALVAGEMLTTRFELDYVSTANTADGILNLWEVGLEGDQ